MGSGPPPGLEMEGFEGGPSDDEDMENPFSSGDALESDSDESSGDERFEDPFADAGGDEGIGPGMEPAEEDGEVSADEENPFEDF